MSDYKVGQELYWVPTDSSERILGCRMVKIEKIGRIWLELSNGYKVDKVKLAAFSKFYGPPGRCYLDRAVRELQVAAEQDFSNLSRKIYYMHAPPAGVSAVDIRKAAALLGVAI